MEPRVSTVDGSPVTIRPMDMDYIMADQEPPGIEVAVACRLLADPAKWPNPMYVTYYEKLTRAYGACAILAWQADTVVGFLPFAPLDCGHRLPSCLHYVDDDDMREVAAFSPVPQTTMSPKVLVTHCLSVKQSLRRQGLGSEMVRYLAEWASASGWERIQGWAFEKSTFGWLPDIVFWEKCGFRRGKARGWDECITDPGFEYHMDL